MSMKSASQVQGSPEFTSLAALVMVLAVDVCARPCYEGGDFELCFLSKASVNDDEVVPDFREQFSQNTEPRQAREGQKYEMVFRKREMRDVSEENHRNCTGCDEDSDVVDREDHVTQYLSELLVNTDSEITSLQASEVEETREESGTKDDGYFAFLTGAEKIFEIEGIWSEPAKTVVEESELLNYNA